MRQLMFEAPGQYAWRDAPDLQIAAPGQALVRPVAVACCDLDVAVAQGRLPMPPGHAVGHEGVAEVVAVGDDVATVKVGDRVIVPFQINCGTCSACRRGVTGSCASLPLMAMYGMAPIAGSRRRRLHGRPGVWCRTPTRCWCRCPTASTRWRSPRCRTTSPTAGARSGRISEDLAGLDADERRVLVVGRLSIGLYAAAFGVGTRRARRLRRHRPARAWPPPRNSVRQCTIGQKPDQVVGSVPGHRAHLGRTRIVLAATLARHLARRRVHRHRDLPRSRSRCRCCRCTPGVCDSSRAGSTLGPSSPEILELISAGCDLAPAVERVVPWDDADSVWPTMTGKTVFSRVG